MATSDISKQAVFDKRVAGSLLSPRYAVVKGALSLTNSPYQAISATNSQHSFNVNVPSQNVYIDRAILWSCDCNLSIPVTMGAGSGAVANSYTPILSFGLDCALAAFPLQQLVQTMTATINDTSVTINIADVINEVLRLTDYKANRLRRTCPTMLDTYASYNDAYLGINNPLAGYAESTEASETPNGAWWNVLFTDAAGLPLGAPTAGDFGFYQPTGSTTWVAFIGANTVANPSSNGIPVRSNGQAGVPAGGLVADNAVYTVYVKFGSTEKLVLPPFVFADSHEYEQGMMGINNIQYVLNMSGTPGRVLRSTTANGRVIGTVAFNNINNSAFQSSRLNVQYLTPSLDLPLEAKNTLPYLEFPRYVNTGIAPATAFGNFQVVSQTIVLPQIPDSLIIYVKPQTYAATDGEWYYPIERAIFNWDNFAGLLSSHTQEELYAMTVNNGLEVSFEEFRGYARVGKTGGIIRTVGAPLVLCPGRDITLQSGQAAGLIGNYVLNFTLTCTNPTNLAQIPYRLFIVTVNSGFFESLSGSSRIIKGVLSEADIISAEPAPESMSMARLVGAGFMDKIGSMLSKAKDIYTATKPIVSGIKGMLPEEGLLGKVKKVAGAVGYGRAGAGMAGAGMAGGRRSLSDRLM